MKRWIVVLAVLAGAVWTAVAEKPRVSRAALAALERNFDRRIERYNIDDPFYLLGNTRGVYLEGYGVVFTAELNLVAGAVITPFRPKFSKEEIEKLHQKKLSRVPVLKETMRAMMVSSATALTAMPPQEQVVVGVTIFHYSWEDSTGLPAQILMLAQRQALLDIEAGRIKGPAIEGAIRVQEF
jgi:hypothetical protein